MSGSFPAPAQVTGIVIGASAGGVDALLQLLPALPPGLAAPVCVTLHLAPQGESLLAQIFSPYCRLPVKEVEDGEPLANGAVYFAAPNYHFLVEPGPRVALSVDEPVHFSRPAIDLLFQSAADVFGAGTLGILLTGSNQDGAEGLQEIHAVGGSVVIQDPLEAQAPAMVLAALGRMPGHAVMTLREIAASLAQLTEGMACNAR